MAAGRMDLGGFVGKLLEQEDVDTLRERVRVLAQAVMEAEVSGEIGGGTHHAAGYTTSGGTNWGGGSVRFQTKNYFAYDWANGGFAPMVLWVNVENTTNDWVEMGWTHGWAGQNLRTLYRARCCP